MYKGLSRMYKGLSMMYKGLSMLYKGSEAFDAMLFYLENSGEAHLLMVRGSAKVHGACHICSATVKLTAAVQQQQGVLVHLLAASFLCPVVDDSSVPASPCTACKA